MFKRIRTRLDGNTEHGFTVIEFLVVIIIIGILLAIAVPSYLGFRDRAANNAAKDNLRAALPSAEAYYADDGAYSAYMDTPRARRDRLGHLPNPDGGVGDDHDVLPHGHRQRQGLERCRPRAVWHRLSRQQQLRLTRASRSAAKPDSSRNLRSQIRRCARIRSGCSAGSSCARTKHRLGRSAESS